MVMKRKIMSIMMMVAMLFSMNITAFAVDRIGAPIAHAMRSSSYLDSYTGAISPVRLGVHSIERRTVS